MYKTVIKPTMTYGAECRAVRKKDENRLHVAEKRMLRWIRGDCSLGRRFCSPKVRKSEIKGSSFRRFCSPKVRKSEYDF